MKRTTKQLAEQIAADLGVSDVDLIYRRLLVFLSEDFTDDEVEKGGPRYKAMTYAHAHNYFWLPCVLCGRWTGGQENVGFPACVKLNNHSGRGTCNSPACVQEAARINSKYPNGIVEKQEGKQ